MLQPNALRDQVVTAFAGKPTEAAVEEQTTFEVTYESNWRQEVDIVVKIKHAFGE